MLGQYGFMMWQAGGCGGWQAGDWLDKLRVGGLIVWVFQRWGHVNLHCVRGLAQSEWGILKLVNGGGGRA